MDMPRIIAAHAGCGKSYFCDCNESAIDFICMPFKYSNFYELVGNGKEQLKASEELDFVFGWQNAYYKAILDTYHCYSDQIIVIPSEARILECLSSDNIPYLLVYPKESAKEEYRQRYINRGDSENFIHVFMDEWDRWMEQLREYEGCERIELEEGQFLSDVVDLTGRSKEDFIKNKENYIYEKYFK